jgi:hypothetical protein
MAKSRVSEHASKDQSVLLAPQQVLEIRIASPATERVVHRSDVVGFDFVG